MKQSKVEKLRSCVSFSVLCAKFISKMLTIAGRIAISVYSNVARFTFWLFNGH